MISSMTGFGKGTAAVGNLVAEAEIKSFNSRFLDFSIRIPRKIANREFDIRNLIKKEIKRGKLNLTVQIKREGVDEDFVSISPSDLNNTLSLIRQIKDTAKIKDDITLTHILSFQNSFLNEEENYSEDEFKVASEAIILAIAELKNHPFMLGSLFHPEFTSRPTRPHPLFATFVKAACDHAMTNGKDKTEESK